MLSTLVKKNFSFLLPNWNQSTQVSFRWVYFVFLSDISKCSVQEFHVRHLAVTGIAAAEQWLSHLKSMGMLQTSSFTRMFLVSLASVWTSAVMPTASSYGDVIFKADRMTRYYAVTTLITSCDGILCIKFFSLVKLLFAFTLWIH